MNIYIHRLRDEEAEVIFMEVAHFQKRKRERNGIAHWIAFLSALAVCGAIWYTLAQVWLWREGWLRP